MCFCVLGHVHKEPTALSESQLAEEAERIIQQVDQISCVISPNPAAASITSAYETRSLERRPRRAHRSPEGSGRPVRRSPERHHSPEPDSGRKLDPILESQLSRDSYVAQDIRTSPVTTSGGKDTSKYDSGIEMEFQNQQLPPQRMGYESLPDGERPPLTRHNVNLIVQQLTEEARIRERMRKKLELEGLDALDGAPRLPALNVIEPNAEFGLSHNKNLPFSYTGGSPIRTTPGRFPSPPRKLSSDSQPESLPAAPRNDIVYATVVRDRPEAARMQRQTSSGSSDKSPAGRGSYQRQVSIGSAGKLPAERSSYTRQPSNGSSDKIPAGRPSYQRQASNDSADKIPTGRPSYQRQASDAIQNEEVDIIPIIRQHLRPDGQDDPPDVAEDMDYRKARFLFGDDGTGHSKSFRRQEKVHPHLSTDPDESSSPDQPTFPSYRRNIRNNNNINSSSNNINNNHIINNNNNNSNNNNNNNNNQYRSHIRVKEIILTSLFYKFINTSMTVIHFKWIPINFQLILLANCFAIRQQINLRFLSGKEFEWRL